MTFDPRSDYPLGTSRPDLVTTPGGTPLAELTLERLRAGGLSAEELRATAGTLARQAEVADASGSPELARNLRRAAELAAVPADTILELYTALRPHRSSGAELAAWARRLEQEYGAVETAAFVREAAGVYAERGLLAGERAPV
jgi:propanediol dehydratase small subunit